MIYFYYIQSHFSSSILKTAAITTSDLIAAFKNAHQVICLLPGPADASHLCIK